MKTFNITSLALVLLTTLSLFTSCSKDKDLDQELKDVASVTLVGDWSVSDGEATVYQDGTLLADINLTTFGSIEFYNDGSGMADFGIQIGDEKDELTGPFTWVDEAFEIIITYPDNTIERWSKVDDETNMKKIQLTQKDEEENRETELLLTLLRS